MEVRWFEPAAKAPDLVELTFGDESAGLQFAVDPRGDRLWVDWLGHHPGQSMQAASTFLLGPILGAILRLRGTVSLHASVLDVGSAAVVLLAETGCGKSTLAAAMAQRGHAVLSDDVGALAELTAGTWIAHPGYPRLRLWPAAIAAIEEEAGSHADAGPVLWGIDKRFVALSSSTDARCWRFQTRPLPVAAVYELVRTGDKRAAVTAIEGRDCVATLLRHTRVAIVPLAREAQAEEFARLCRLATSIPFRRLAVPDDLGALPDVCELLASDAAGSPATG